MGRRKGTGTVWPKGKGWEGEITVGRDHLNKRIKRYAYGEASEEVFEKLARLRDEYLREQAKEREEEVKRTTLQELYDRWLSAIRLNVSEGTCDRYQLDAGYWLPYLGKVVPADLPPRGVEEWFEKALANGLTVHQVYKGLVNLRRVLDYASRFDYVTRNVAQLVEAPRIEREGIHPLDKGQLQALFAATAKSRLAALYIVAVDTGARMGELFALEWSDWFPETCEISFTKTLNERNGKHQVKEPRAQANRRTVCVSEKTAQALEDHRARLAASGYKGQLIFGAGTGSYLRRSDFHVTYWKPALKKAGLPHIRFQDLRHTCAILLIQAGDNLKSVADRLGHANPTLVLKTYGHVVPQLRKESARESARLMESLL